MSTEIEKIELQIDERRRRFWQSTLIVSVTFREELDWTTREHEAIDRYAFQVEAHMFGRDGDPSREEAEIYPFEQLAWGRSFVLDRNAIPPRIRQVTATTRNYRFDPDPDNIDRPNDSTTLLKGEAKMVFGIDDLDVDKAESFYIWGRKIIIPKADSIFAKVSIVDLIANEVVLTAESQPISGFYGVNESLAVPRR